MQKGMWQGWKGRAILSALYLYHSFDLSLYMIFGGSPVMGREPPGLPASGEFHTWLPWPSAPPALELIIQAKQTMLGSTTVSIKWGRPWA
eukprot:910229-Pelagomonas_calceolata.AAC.1